MSAWNPNGLSREAPKKLSLETGCGGWVRRKAEVPVKDWVSEETSDSIMLVSGHRVTLRDFTS